MKRFSISSTEVLPINGSVMLIPKSHKQGTLAAGHDTSHGPPTRSGTLDPQDGDAAVRRGGAARRNRHRGGRPAKPGKHADVPRQFVTPSPHNIKPKYADCLFTLCAVSNHITKFNPCRMDPHRGTSRRSFRWTDDALMGLASSRRVAAEMTQRKTIYAVVVQCSTNSLLQFRIAGDGSALNNIEAVLTLPP